MPQILVMDDDVQVQSMLRGALEDEGYEVTVASNGKEGLKYWERDHFDLVITDLLMPEKEGLETIIELHKKSPATKIIAVSGGFRDGGIDFLELARKFGASRTFGKPVSLPEFLHSVRELLETTNDEDGEEASKRSFELTNKCSTSLK